MVNHGVSDISLPECVFLYETSPDKQSHDNECGEENAPELDHKIGIIRGIRKLLPLKANAEFYTKCKCQVPVKHACTY